MVNGFRYGVLGIADIPIWISYLIILGFIALLASFSMYLLNRGIGVRT